MERRKRQHMLDAGMRGWIVNCAKKNIWRVPTWYDLDDLIQDGFICYCHCRIRYAHIEETRHFMALVKTSFANHIHDLANKRTRTTEKLVPPDSPTLSGVELPEGMFLTLLKQLPRELQGLIEILLESAWNIPMLRYANGARETNNQYLCRLLDVDPETVNVMAIFKEHFGA